AFGQKVERQTSRPLGAELRRECRAQVSRVLPDVLADRRALAQLVEQVVADLISRAEAFAVAGERCDVPLASAGGDGAGDDRQARQRGGFELAAGDTMRVPAGPPAVDVGG